jgi:hypothetical protein
MGGLEIHQGVKEVGGKSCVDWLLAMKKARVVTFLAYIKSSSHVHIISHSHSLNQSVQKEII